MPSNINQFTAEVGRFHGDEIPKELTKLHRATTLDLFTRLVRTTPVDTGRARANWQVSNGSPPTDELEYAGGGGGAAAFAISRETPTALQAEAPGVTWVANNLPYIGRLNDGSSTQAPAGFVQLAINEATRR